MRAREAARLDPPPRRPGADPDRPPHPEPGVGPPVPHPAPPHPPSGGVRLKREPSGHGDVCHCGHPIVAGQAGYRIVDFPIWVEHLVAERSFCSRPCVREFFVDSLTEIERLRLIDEDRTVVDLRETHRVLSSVFADLRAALLSSSP